MFNNQKQVQNNHMNNYGNATNQTSGHYTGFNMSNNPTTHNNPITHSNPINLNNPINLSNPMNVNNGMNMNNNNMGINQIRSNQNNNLNNPGFQTNSIQIILSPKR
eukprot:GHVR01160579.1.p1 GENE.GHVR01160579.1~~GHVR01160579.1.p1  ORF type:complete len:106 (-),score=0.39 GHVR01160579.1:687-1004(-)